ncbi:hypothetical protein, partial [Mycolicibacterium sp.]|uniref:hypothetical protein n=1 Tax=Mycolicibacterium sp. TaxID=2320850 RepID=UPI003D151D79
PVQAVAGAVLPWPVDAPDGAAPIAYPDVDRAAWLGRAGGVGGHSALVAAVADAPVAGVIDLPGVEIATGALAPLRRLALGHWLRRWWPGSQRDGIAELDAALLDGELALRTAAAEDYLGDDTFDSEVTALLHPAALHRWARDGDPRAAELARACVELGEDLGVAATEPEAAPVRRRADYALAAGAGADRRAEAIASGVSSLRWAAVPPGVFDAAEHTVDWRIEATGSAVRAVVRTELSGPASPDGIAVRVTSGPVAGAGVLDAAGAATVELFDDGRAALTESAAWNHDWRDTSVGVGADVDEPQQVRDRVRDFARDRLRRPAPDAFLAEILAAESDY